MNARDAESLLASAITTRGGAWADLGAGEGTFTRALAELLGPTSRIHAVDREARAIASLERVAASVESTVITVTADFTQPFELPGLGDTLLDGMLFANALHFVRDADVVLARLARWIRPGGNVVFVEYDQRTASRWVPYPISPERLKSLALAAGLSTPKITAMRPSMFSGNLYVATSSR